MRLLSNKIFKNYQVNLGMPVQIRPPVNFHTLQHAAEAFAEEEEAESVELCETAEDILAKAREEADLIVKEARLEAIRLLEMAEKEITETRLLAEAEAKNQGYADGLKEGRSQYDDLIQEAGFIREHARAEYKEVLEGIESEAVNVILDIAKKVIGAEVGANRESILSIVRQAFERCANKGKALLKVAPEDYEYLMENREKLLSVLEGADEPEIKKDSSLKPGACVVETAYGSIDAGVETKLEKIEEAYRQVIGQG